MQTEKVSDLSDIIDKFKNYSKSDGHLCRILNKKITLRRKEIFYCPKCKTKNNLNSLYCKNCGCNLESVVEDKNSISLNKIKSNIDFKHCSKVVLLSSLILFLISFLLSIFVNLIFKSQLFSYLNIINIFLLLNGAKLNGAVSLGSNFGYYQNSGFYFQLNLILFILMPILVNMLVYKVLSKNRKSTFNDAVGVGLIYSLLLIGLTFLSRNNYVIGGGFINSYTVVYSISFFSVLIRGFLIGFLPIFILNLNKINNNLFVYILKSVLKITVLGYFIVFTMVILASFININFISEFGISKVASKLNIFIVLSQLAAYLWSFANCNPFIIGGKNIFIFNLFSSSMSIEIKLFLLVFIAISALILIISGNKLRLKYKKGNRYTVLVFSLVYSVAMGILSIFTNINIDMSVLSGITLYIGSSFIVTILISFIYSYVFTYIGYKLSALD